MILMGHAAGPGRHVTCWKHLGGPLKREVDAVPEQVDLRVHDRVALDEIELYSEVLSAVAASDKPLTHEELDRALGVLPMPGRPAVRVPESALSQRSAARDLHGWRNMTSVVRCVKPSDLYSLIAGRFASSTYSMTAGRPRERR